MVRKIGGGYLACYGAGERGFPTHDALWLRWDGVGCGRVGAHFVRKPRPFSQRKGYIARSGIVSCLLAK